MRVALGEVILLLYRVDAFFFYLKEKTMRNFMMFNYHQHKSLFLNSLFIFLQNYLLHLTKFEFLMSHMRNRLFGHIIFFFLV